MDINDIINEYTEVKDILYRDERYSVRDNGAVLRHPKDSSKELPKKQLKNKSIF